MGLRHKVGWDPWFVRRSPWFWPLARAATAFAGHRQWPTCADFETLYAELAGHSGAPMLRFGDNVRRRDKRASGRVVFDALYDARVALHHEVPTRERDWHDLFNALCFATFPRIKHALHGRHCAILRARLQNDSTALPSSRTREQDALTLFDEGGVLIAAEPAVAAELVDAEDTDLVAALATPLAEGSARVVPVGHALFEHLVEGLMMPGARAYVLPCSLAALDDATLCSRIDASFASAVADPRRFLSPREQKHLRLGALTPPAPAP